jgi:hypothetical protein
MNLEAANNLANLHHVPAGNGEFESLSQEEKLRQLGSRLAAITVQNPEDALHHRVFNGSLAAENGSKIELILEAYYDHPHTGVLLPETCHSVKATWLIGGQYLAIEQFGPTFADVSDPEEAINILSRLEETMVVAEGTQAQATS